MKLPVPTNGSRIWTPLSLRERAEILFQDVFDAAHHEVHDGLRRVDDAVGVGFLGREALEEALVHGVDEVLLLAIVLGGFGGRLDGAVKAVEVFRKASRLKSFAVIESMTFSISAAMTLRREKSG